MVVEDKDERYHLLGLDLHIDSHPPWIPYVIYIYILYYVDTSVSIDLRIV